MQRLTANTGELKFMAWDVMRTFFYIDLTVKKGNLKELIIFIIAYVVLHYPPYSVLYISYFWKQLLKTIRWNRCSPKLSKIL